MTVTVIVTEHIPNTIYIFIYNNYVQISNSLKEVLINLYAEKRNKIIDKRRLVRYNYNIIKKDIKQRKLIVWQKQRKSKLSGARTLSKQDLQNTMLFREKEQELKQAAFGKWQRLLVYGSVEHTERQ